MRPGNLVETQLKEKAYHHPNGNEGPTNDTSATDGIAHRLSQGMQTNPPAGSMAPNMSLEAQKFENRDPEIRLPDIDVRPYSTLRQGVRLEPKFSRQKGLKAHYHSCTLFKAPSGARRPKIWHCAYMMCLITELIYVTPFIDND